MLLARRTRPERLRDARLPHPPTYCAVGGGITPRTVQEVAPERGREVAPQREPEGLPSGAWRE
jgi:hypothetical protein